MSSFGSTCLGWLCWFLGIAFGGISAFWANCALAQITPDWTLPNNSIVTPDGSILNITRETQAQSDFIITGRGGLPPNPSEALSTDAIQVNLVTFNSSSDRHNSLNVSKQPTTPTLERIVEATEWVLNEKGEVVLTAKTITTPYSPLFNPASCRAS